MSAAPEEKMTAERLIKIADEAGKIYKGTFLTAYVEATRTCLAAFKQAKDQGMDEDLAGIVLVRLNKVVDETTKELDAELSALGKEFGLE